MISNKHTSFRYLLAACLLLLLASPFDSGAAGIDQLLLENVPVPSKRPSIEAVINQPNVPLVPQQESPSVQIDRFKNLPVLKVKAASGNLKSGLEAISNKKLETAVAIRNGLAAGSLDRKILTWAIALSGNPTVPSGEIQKAKQSLHDWPGQKQMQQNFETAIARERYPARTTINILGASELASVEGGIALARAHLSLGDGKRANVAIAPFWRLEALDGKKEKRILSSVGKALTRSDHRFRMHRLFYRDRATGASRMGSLAEQVSLAKARAAVVRRSKKADKLLKSVAASSKKDPGYLFASIQQARRSDNPRLAAKLMLSAPTDSEKLVHPDEWWVERRLVSRAMLDVGDAKTAYTIAAAHSAESRPKIAEAEFHAGWYALRFLKDAQRARNHFNNILRVSSRPISQARGYYWLGRSHRGPSASRYYQEAAKYPGTFYGQLAMVELKKRRLAIRKPAPSASDRNRFASRELVKAIVRLENLNEDWRAGSIYRHLARNLNSPGELALLSLRAEKNGKLPLALQVGKIAYGRGLAVETLSWPTGAIPSSAKTGEAGKALAYAIARQESAFNPTAVSPAKARGLLQLLPGTAKQVARKAGVKYSFKRLTADPSYNIMLGSAYLDEQLDNFGNSYILTFAGYNAGPGRVRDWIERFMDFDEAGHAQARQRAGAAD